MIDVRRSTDDSWTGCIHGATTSILSVTDLSKRSHEMSALDEELEVGVQVSGHCGTGVGSPDVTVLMFKPDGELGSFVDINLTQHQAVQLIEMLSHAIAHTIIEE